MAKKKDDKEKKSKAQVHKDLDGFELGINSFGEVTSSLDIDKINEFLDENVEDKKLSDRSDNEKEEEKDESENEN